MKESNNTLVWTGQKEWEPWTGSNRCPNCGGSEIECNSLYILTSNPPQHQLRCKSCGHHFASGFEHDQSILNIPKVGDWPPAQTPCDPLPATDKTTTYGWICPKCGRALAPHMDSCPYCSVATTINITY